MCLKGIDMLHFCSVTRIANCHNASNLLVSYQNIAKLKLSANKNNAINLIDSEDKDSLGPTIVSNEVLQNQSSQINETNLKDNRSFNNISFQSNIKDIINYVSHAQDYALEEEDLDT